MAKWVLLGRYSNRSACACLDADFCFMSDLIERLRNKESIFVAKDCKEAADEIERLQGEVDADIEIRAAMTRVIDGLQDEIERLERKLERISLASWLCSIEKEFRHLDYGSVADVAKKCDGRLENCGALTQTEYLDGECADCDYDRTETRRST